MNKKPEQIIAAIADHFALVDEEFDATEDKELKLIYSITRARIYDILLEVVDYDEGLAEIEIEEAIRRLENLE